MALKDDRIEQCLRSCGSEFHMWGPKQEKLKDRRSLSLSDSKIPAYYYFAERNAQVIHCRLRLEMSNLNNDLVNRHLSTDPKCSCGYSRETAEHYLLHCLNYFNIRARTILILPSNQTNIRTLLYGNLDLRLQENKHIFLTVHEFIKLAGS